MNNLRSWIFPSIIGFIILSFIVNILGLMKVYPLVLTSPLLFISLFLLIAHMNYRQQFRGFK
ncbi:MULTISPECIES: hypothetical protein [Bacillus]|uniref:hypothetical protein n=1 Tax=Bacillus TaxID=1386 RepID=UPI000BB8F31D|nr:MULTISPECIES: hypothetical protein [Bacillus]